MTPGRRVLLAVVCGIAVAGLYVAQPMLEAMGQELGIGDSAAGWVVAAGQLGYLAGLILLVPLGDMLDRRRLIVAQLVLTGTGLLVTATAPGAPLALAGLALAGSFAVVVQTTVAYAAAVARPQERGHTIGVVTSGVVIGILGGRVLAGAMAQTWGWRSVYLTLGALAITVAVVVRIALPADVGTGRATSYRRILGSLIGLTRHRVFWSRGLIAFFLFASFGTLWSGMSLPLHAAPWHLTEGQIGLFGLVGLAGAVAAARAGAWADHGHARRVSGIALALLAISWALIGQLSWSLGLLVIGVVVLDFAVQATHVSNQHVLTSAFPDRASTVLGGYMAFYSLGSAAGAAASTALYSAADWGASSLLGAALAAAGLLVWAITPAGPGTPTPAPAAESARVADRPG